MTTRKTEWADGRFPRLVLLARLARWLADPRGRRSRRTLRSLKDTHRGQRCFIIGNGPSLKEMDLRPLAGEKTFSLNRGYLLFERMGGPSTYHVVVNPLVVQQWARDLERLPCRTFASWGTRHRLDPRSEVVYIEPPSSRLEPYFSKEVTRGMWQGATVTYVALQLAFYLGFEKVVLIGVDHRFRAQGIPNQEVVSTSSDVDHFAPDYFGPGARWQLPDLETSELAYTLARHYYRQDGRVILDATVNGALQVFPKAEFASLFR